jgi:predicted rRNA methylase YqxC with S4 and FtsJ domains
VRSLAAGVSRLPSGWEGVVLVKPQFEAGRPRWKGGVVRDARCRRRVVREVAEAALAWGAKRSGVVDSGLAGPEGQTGKCFSILDHRSPELPTTSTTGSPRRSASAVAALR